VGPAPQKPPTAVIAPKDVTQLIEVLGAKVDGCRSPERQVQKDAPGLIGSRAPRHQIVTGLVNEHADGVRKRRADHQRGAQPRENRGPSERRGHSKMRSDCAKARELSDGIVPEEVSDLRVRSPDSRLPGVVPGDFLRHHRDRYLDNGLAPCKRNRDDLPSISHRS